MRGFISRLFTVVGISLVVGCSDPVTPTPEAIAGTYAATTFALSGEVNEDVLAAGGGLTITFNADGTTSGNLFVPASASGGVDLTADMAGTFVLENDSITITQDADSFVRDLMWTVDSNRIRGTGTFSGVTITIVLSKISVLPLSL